MTAPDEPTDPADLFDRAPCGYLTTTPDGVILRVNSTFLDWTGLRRDDLVGSRTFASLLSAGGRIYHETHYAPMLRLEGAASEIALDVVCADGSRLPVLVNSVLSRDRSGAPVEVRTAVFGASDRREYERELLRAKERAEASEAHAQTLARTLQETLIPPAPPDVPGLDVDAVYRPAGRGDEVGGDFYDVFEISPGDWVVVVGDVCGKGVEAAVITAVARHTIRAATVRHPDSREALDVLNEVLLRHRSDRFCTLVLVRLRQADEGWTATISSAGHPLPLLVRPGDRPVEVGRYGSVAGVLADPRFHEDGIDLRPGDALVLYTDGVTEGRRDRDFFGEQRLADAVARHQGSASSLCHGVLDDVMGFQRGVPRDDVVVLAAQVSGEISPVQTS
jgi:sigma-B regulation protein RsbU (phosphoserine phosphatase)